MKIAINVQTWVKDNREGLGWFTYETISRIIKNHPEHQFLLIFGKGICDDFSFPENTSQINIGPPFFRPIAWFIKFQLLLNWVLRKNKVDLYVSTDGFSNPRVKIKNLLVVHDLNFENNKHWLSKNFSFYYRKFFPLWVKNATRIATVSEFSKLDINKHYGFESDKIDVVFNGSNEQYVPIQENEKITIKAKYSAGEDFFIFISSIHPRKNLPNQLKAFDAFKAKSHSKIKFIIIGGLFNNNKSLNQIYNDMRYKDDVIFTGHLQAVELHKLLATSIALVYASLFEGFGIPIIEAMNCKTAVITSNVTSMPEIAGDAAVLVDPYSVHSIADAMNIIYSDKEFREQLIEEGWNRAKRFSWNNTAEALWDSIIKVINE